VSAKQERVFECPRCHQTEGRQDKFTLHERDKIKVIVRCGECRHRWSVILAADDYSGVTLDRAD
jgi:transcription elongation factor Elf1